MKKFNVTINGNSYEVEVEEVLGSPRNPQVIAAEAVSNDNKDSVVKSPAHGKVVDIRVSVGDTVEKDQVLLVLEAMKMKNEILAPKAGTIAAVHVGSGDTVQLESLLVTFGG